MKNRAVKIIFIIFAHVAFLGMFGAKLYESTVLAAERQALVERHIAESEEESFAPVAAEGAALQFTLDKMLGEGNYSFEGGKGGWTLIHFWATWCPSCLFEVGTLIKFAEMVDTDKLRIIAISLDTDKDAAVKFWERVKKHVTQKEEIPIITLMDPEGDLAHKYGTFKLPETFIVSPEGNLAYKFIGPRNWLSEPAESFVKKLLSR